MAGGGFADLVCVRVSGWIAAPLIASGAVSFCSCRFAPSSGEGSYSTSANSISMVRLVMKRSRAFMAQPWPQR